jgi:hypothetical protein
VSTSGELLDEVELEHHLVNLYPARDRVLAEVVGEDERSLVDLGAGPDGAPRELATTEVSGRWTVRRLPEGHDVAIWNPGSRRAGRVVRLGASTEELRVVGQPRSLLDEEIRVLGSTAFAGDALEQELDRRLPPVPGAGSREVHLVVWDYLEEPPWSYALVARDGEQLADVFALAPGAEDWRPLIDDLPWIRERDHVSEATASPCVSLPPLPHALCSDGVVARPDPDGHGGFALLDLAHGTEQRMPGALRRFERVSRRVALAGVASVEFGENPVTLSPLGLAVYRAPFGISHGSWSEPARGLIYEDLEGGRLQLWTPGVGDSVVLWPLRE